jgi:serine/threonine protein kinase
MERLLGGTLNDRVASSRERSARVRAEQCLSMMAGLTQALGYLHFQASATHFVVHRDIKVPR